MLHAQNAESWHGKHEGRWILGIKHTPPCLLMPLSALIAELRHAHTKALDAVAEGVLPRLRPVLDEVAAVRALDHVGASSRFATICLKTGHFTSSLGLLRAVLCVSQGHVHGSQNTAHTTEAQPAAASSCPPAGQLCAE